MTARAGELDVAGTLRPGAPDDALAGVVEAASRFVLAHPAAAQVLFRALVDEGRRIAATPGGRRLQDALAASELVRRGRAFWDGSALALLEDAPDVLLPAGVREALLHRLAGRVPASAPADAADRPRLLSVGEPEP